MKLTDIQIEHTLLTLAGDIIIVWTVDTSPYTVPLLQLGGSLNYSTVC